MYLQTSTIQPGIGTELVQHATANRGPCGGTCSGLGLFDSMDFTTWSWPEWGVVAFLGYALFAVVSTTKRGAKTLKRKLRRKRTA